jgi:hypothetical protein
MAGDIVGLDTLPAAVYKDYKDLFNKFLPGFANTAEYNLQPGAYSKVAAEQTGYLMQRGPHPSINSKLLELVKELDDNKDVLEEFHPGLITKRLAALVNFMRDASSPNAIASGGKNTANWIAFE